MRRDSYSLAGQIQALWAMARPLIMVSVLLVFIAGLVIARALGHTLMLEPVLWSATALVLVVLSIHYVNEYADYATDALTTATRYSGGSGALPKGLAPRGLALIAGWGTLVSGLMLAVIGFVVAALTLSLVIILLIGAFLGWMYSLPPLRLAWHGWGELDNAFLGGILLPLYGYVTVTGQIDWRVVLGCVPFMLLVFNNLLGTTWADRDADTQAGKYTLATRWSVLRLRRLYAVVVLMTFVLLALLYNSVLPPTVVLGSLAVVPFVLWGLLGYTRIHSPAPSSQAMLVFLVGQMLGWLLFT